LHDARQLGLEFFGQRFVALVGGMVTVKGIRLKRRRMASSTDLRPGL
jgi:hypothetical protein